MKKKWLQGLDRLAKKGSSMGGKLGIISRAVDAIIPDATPETAKGSKAGGDTNTGDADSKGMNYKNTDLPASGLPPSPTPDNKDWKSKWGAMPTWAKGSIIAAIAGLLVLLVKSMMGKKYKYGRR
jgi:hypothetical protein